MRQYRVEVRQAWWLLAYLCALAIACVATGREPDPVKFERTVTAAMRLRVVRNRAVVAA